MARVGHREREPIKVFPAIELAVNARRDSVEVARGLLPKRFTGVEPVRQIALRENELRARIRGIEFPEARGDWSVRRSES